MLQGESNPGLLARLAEALSLDHVVNWILAEKKSLQYDLRSQQIFVKILLTQETSTMCSLCSRYLSRFLDFFAHPNLNSTLDIDQKLVTFVILYVRVFQKI